MVSKRKPDNRYVSPQDAAAGLRELADDLEQAKDCTVRFYVQTWFRYANGSGSMTAESRKKEPDHGR